MTLYSSSLHILKGIALLFLILVIRNGHTQSLINYSISEGLPSNEVYDIYQDPKGFLWFATDNGVVRYDGSELKLLHVKDGLTDPVVFSFYEDDDKNIWFKTYSGKLCYFNALEEKIMPYPFNDRISEIVKSGLLFSISLDREKTLHLSTGGLESEFVKIDKQGSVSREKLSLKSFTYRNINHSAILGFNPLQGKLDQVILNGTIFPVAISESKVPSSVVCSTYIGNKLFFSIGLDLFEYANGNLRKVLVAKLPIISLSKDKSDCLWIGYLNNGVDRLTKGSSQVEPFLLLSKKSVTKILQDAENGYWFSTLENGIYYLPNKNIKTVPNTNDTKIKSVIYAFNQVITGDQKGNLLSFDGVTKKPMLSLNMGTPIMSFLLEDENKLWVSTNNSITIFDSKIKVIKKITGQSKVDFTIDQLGSVWGTGLASTLFDKKGNPKEHYLTGANRAIVATDSLLLIAGKIGMEFRSKKFELILSPKELKNVKIRKMDRLNDSTVLLSSIGNGPILLNTRTKTSDWLVTSRNFPADNIYTAVITDAHLWLGTEKGIFRIDRKHLFNKKIPFQHISRQSGLLDNKINFMVKVEHQLWAFSDNGISILPITDSSFDNQNPIFYIKDLFINNKKFKTNNNQSIQLLHEENYIRLDVGFISFNNQDIKIRFRVSENEDWSYTSNKSIEFFSLSPGKYNINLEFSTNNILWTPGIKNLVIYIKPPWWGIWYFQLLIGLLLIFWIAFFALTRISLIKQKQIYLQSLTNHQRQIIQSEIESIEKERTRIAKDLHDGIGTTLTSIKMGINQVMTKYNQDEANEVENRLQDVLKEVKNIIHDLTPPALIQFGLHEGLRNYIEKISSDTHVLVKLNIFGEEIKQPKINLFVFRIIQELVINSLKHSNAKNITIHLSAFDDLLNILYEDDGIGFSVDEVTRGNGLYNIESRIQALQGKILFETSSKGVSYSIDIPLV